MGISCILHLNRILDGLHKFCRVRLVDHRDLLLQLTADAIIDTILI